MLTTPSGATTNASEPTLATADSTTSADAALVSRVVATYDAPTVSLRSADDAVCIMNDTP